jgi:hypothetical protein
MFLGTHGDVSLDDDDDDYDAADLRAHPRNSPFALLERQSTHT